MVRTKNTKRRETISIESVKAFLERIRNDEEWRNKLNAAQSKEERLAMAKAEGFDFTEEELNLIRDELSEEMLDKIAGGRHSSSGTVKWF